MKLRSIQALRALAALLVIFDHFPRLEAKIFPAGLTHNFGAAGAIGVDLFFVISGFIMVTTTWDAFATPGASTRFLTRRFLRIYPAYWAALAAFVAIGLSMPSALYLAPVDAPTLLTSIFLIPHVSGPLLFVAWSLEFEVYFYLVFALALKFGRERLGLIFGFWLACTLGFNVAAHFIDLTVVQFLGNPLALEFMGGGLVGYLVLHRHAVAPRASVILGTLATVAIALYSARFADGFAGLNLTWFRVLTAGPAMMLIVYGAVVIEERARVAPPRFLVRLGDASYAMYLWHGMLLGAYGFIIARLHPHGRLADAAYILGGLALVIMGSLGIFRFVEVPLTSVAKRAVKFAGKPARAVVPAPLPNPDGIGVVSPESYAR